MQPELTPATPSSWVDYLPVAWAILTLILIPMLRRRTTILAFIRTILEAASKSQKAAETASNGNGNGNGSYLVNSRMAATLAESQSARIETVEETQKNNTRRIEAIEKFNHTILPELQSAARQGALNAFSGQMNQQRLDIAALQANDEIQRADILSLRELLAANTSAIAANAARIKALEDQKAA